MDPISDATTTLPIVWRDDEGLLYDKARVGRVFNARRPQRFPHAVVNASSEQYVVDAVKLARKQDRRVSVRSGGHSWAAWSVRDEAILIDLGNLRCIDFDEAKQIVRVSPSTTGHQLNSFLVSKGYFFPGGHCPDVGLGGFLLQGGMGWNCKNWGWACENIRAIDVVNAAGDLIRCSAEQNEELFWMARGAGPGFPGIVVAFHLAVRKAPGAMVQSFFAWPMSKYREVMDWVVKTSYNYDSGTEIVAVSQTLPGHSEHSICALFVAFAETEEKAQAALEPANSSRPSGVVIEDVNQPTSIASQYRAQADANPQGHRYCTDNSYVANDADVASVLEEAFTTLPSPQAFALYYAMHPASRKPLQDMALSMQSDHYFATYTIWKDEADDERCRGWVRDVMKGIERFEEGAYLGDSDFQVRRTKFWSDDRAKRLMELRRKWDPEERICGFLDVGDTSGSKGLENRFEWKEKQINGHVNSDADSARSTPLVPNVTAVTDGERTHTQTSLKAMRRVHNHNINHIGLAVSNLQSAVDWYSKHFGFRRICDDLSLNRKDHGGKPFEMYKNSSAFKIAFLSSGNGVGFELFQFQPIDGENPIERGSFGKEYQRGGYFHMGITVPDPQHTAAAAYEDGAIVVGGPLEVFPGEVAMFIQDPWGNVLELCSSGFEVALANRSSPTSASTSSMA